MKTRQPSRAKRWLALLLSACMLAGCAPTAAQGAGPTTAALPSEMPPATRTPTATRPILASTASPSSTPTAEPSATFTPPPSETASSSPTAAVIVDPGPTPDAEAAGRRVRLPILMYHYIEPWPADADELRRGLTVRPEDFAAQMAYLHEQGYVTVSLYNLIEALARGRPLPERAVVLTFDDGYRTLMDYVAPVLRPLGYTGTVFVITQLMDEGRPQYLSWAEAENLYAEGWKIEPHTKTHDGLAGRERDFQLYQMLGSLQTVEAHIGTTPRFFAYPAGQYDDLSVTLAREMNLWGAVTVEAGRNHSYAERYTWRRVRVSGLTSLGEFITALEGDLLAAPTRTP